MNTVCIPLAPKAGLLFNKISAHLDHGVVGDLSDAVPLFLWVALISLGISLIFLILICCCTTLITWIMIIALAIVFILFGSLLIANVTYTGELNDGVNAIRVKYLSYMHRHKAWIITIGVISILLGLFVFFLICKFRKYISVGIPILSYAAKTTLKNILLIILSVVVLVVQFCVFFIELYIILRLYTTGEEVRDTEAGSPFIDYKLNSLTEFLLVVHFFGMIWLIIVLNNFNDYVCAAITVDNYFNADIKNIRIFCHVLGHNIGTIAWTILLFPIYCLKLVFGVFDFCLTSDNPNGCQRFFNKLFCCCCWCYETFVDSISENYFAISYLGSEGFWKSNSRYYYLTEKYADETYTVLLLGAVFGLVGKLLISFFGGWMGYILYKQSTEYQQNIDNIGALLFLCFLIGFFVGSLFINLFGTTYEAVLACYLCEKNIHDLHGHAITKCPEEIKEVMEAIAQEKEGYEKL